MSLLQNEIEKLNNVTSFDIEHTWKIVDVKQQFSDDEVSLKSPMFSSDNHDIQFQLEIEKNENFLGLFLKCFPGNKVYSNVIVSATLSILNPNNNLMKKTEFVHTFYSLFGYGCLKLFVFNTEINELHVSCKATINYVKTNEFLLQQLAFLNSGKNSDITIVVENNKIFAHKTILSAHSPVFEAMFSYNDTKEAQKQEIEITDVTNEVFKIFLLFIYTGIKPKSEFENLLIVAEKYQVDELKLYCENCLSLANENVIKNYIFADLHNAQKLKENCLSLVVSNYSEIVKTENWEKFCEVATTKEIVKITRAVSEMQISKK